LAEAAVTGTVGLGVGVGVAGDGTDLSAATIRRLACDAEIIPAVLGGQGEVFDVGRTRRLVTVAIWIALVLRDRHCAFPGCDRPPVMCHATTSGTGSSAAEPNCRTSCCCADTTTAPSTTHHGKSDSTPTIRDPNSYPHPHPTRNKPGSDFDPDANSRTNSVVRRSSSVVEPSSVGERCRPATPAIPGHPGGAELTDESLVPGPDAELGSITYDAWAEETPLR
jgi:hypothetical protein